MLPWVCEVSQGDFRMLCVSYVLALVRFAAKKAMDAPRGLHALCQLGACVCNIRREEANGYFQLHRARCTMPSSELLARCADQMHYITSREGGWVGRHAPPRLPFPALPRQDCGMEDRRNTAPCTSPSTSKFPLRWDRVAHRSPLAQTPGARVDS